MQFSTQGFYVTLVVKKNLCYSLLFSVVLSLHYITQRGAKLLLSLKWTSFTIITFVWQMRLLFSYLVLRNAQPSTHTHTHTHTHTDDSPMFGTAHHFGLISKLRNSWNRDHTKDMPLWPGASGSLQCWCWLHCAYSRLMWHSLFCNSVPFSLCQFFFPVGLPQQVQRNIF